MSVKIEKLLAKNIKGVKEVEVIARPHVNEIAGNNEAGKSSLLDSIMYALAGARSIPKEVLRSGESDGSVTVETTSGLSITRSFNANGNTYLKVVAKDGGKYGQAKLDQLWNQFTFDPLAFSKMKPADQVYVLQGLAGKEFCQIIEEIDHNISEMSTERLIVSRQLKAMGSIEPLPQVEQIDIGDLLNRLKEIQAFNRDQKELTLKKDYLCGVAAAKKTELDKLDAEIKRLKENRVLMAADVKAANAAFKSHPDAAPLQDPDPIEAEINAAYETNAKVSAYKENQAKLSDLAMLAEKREKVSGMIESLREKRLDHMKSAPLPVPGVVFSDEGLRINDIPFDQLSSAQKLKISATIGASLAPELRIMRIQDGSLLDKKSFKALTEMAIEKDCQLWIETVGDGHGDAILIEDGSIVK